MKDIQQMCVNSLRFLAVDGVQKANSGHPGMPMGCAPLAYTLYSKFMKFNPKNPNWFNRDRFILSAGHGSMLLYGILHLCGYDVSLEDLKQFRQYGSKTPGHPEAGLTPGVETTTGPLGQGFANAVGMAVANKFLSNKFNKKDLKIVDNKIFAIASDGEMMEGISHEAASFAGHNKLSDLIVFYDSNNISIEGELSLTMSEDVAQRFDAYNWNVLEINDANDLDEIERVTNDAILCDDKPTLIITKTHIGFGSPNKQDKASSHGSPLGEEEVALTKKNLGWPEDKQFYIPEEVYAEYNKAVENGQKAESDWNELLAEYREQYPEDHNTFTKMLNEDFGDDWKNALAEYDDYSSQSATRSISGEIINKIKDFIPGLIGGSADLAPSNNTLMKNEDDFSADNFSGRNFHFGIREHAMASMMNGMSLYGGVLPYGGTFMVFSDYLRPAIRLAAISKLNPIYILTHDSIGLGEDGPTHQPIEHLASLRAIPGLTVVRPADANETIYAWQAAIENKNNPFAILLTRQKLPLLDRTKCAPAVNTLKGGYVIYETNTEPQVILLSSGSEVYLAIEAADKLKEQHISARVVSMPSFELFEEQPDEYKREVLPPSIKKRISIEAAISQGWDKYIGTEGISISIESYGASAPYKTLFEKFGFTVENIVSKIKQMI